MSVFFEHGYALLIGVDENAVPKLALPAVSKDIAALYAVLTHPERCAYRAEQVKQITGKAATRDGITEGSSWLHEKIASDDSGNATVVIYYSGHGWRTSSAANAAFYLIPYDAKEFGLAASALRADAVADMIKELQPKRLLVALDCCHAAGMGVKEVTPLVKGYTPAAAPLNLLSDGKGVTPATIGAKGVEALQNSAGRAILTSSLGDQPSYLRKDGAMSIFTYHLIEALTGHAQPANGASEVLVSDIVSHVHRHVPTSAQADWQAAQTPDYLISGNFPVACLLGGKGIAKGATAPDPLHDLPAEPTPRTTTTIHTSGGAYIRGNVRVDKGDFVGRDKITHGDDVRSDKITIGNMTGNTGVAIGSHARNTTTGTTSGGVPIAQHFAALLALAQVAPPAQRTAVFTIVQAITSEAGQGAQANDQRLARQIEQLATLLPGAAPILTHTFNQPALAPAIGPVTKYVLGKLAE
jgi:uncharacterized caspase-like protein